MSTSGSPRRTTAVSTGRPRILLVDDEECARDSTRMALAHLGYDVDTAVSAEDALEVFDAQRHDLLLTDNRMTGQSGVELAQEIRRRSAATPILMYTGYAPVDRSGLDIVIEKPAPLADLHTAIQTLLARTSPGAPPA